MLYSKLNKLKDRLKFDKHRFFRDKLLSVAKNDKSDLYDYGEGYFYQSCEIINLSGLRNSKQRVQDYKLEDITKNNFILDIGCNSGFLDFQLKPNYKNIIGIDHNETLIEMANLTKDYLGYKNLEFICGDFLDYNFKDKFDVIFSLANHSTFDKGISDSEKYFDKCYKLLNSHGMFVIESHHPNYEDYSQFKLIIDFVLKKYQYEIIDQFIIDSNFFYDNKRTLIKLRKKI